MQNRTCRRCSERFPLSRRAGRDTGRGRLPATSYVRASYCSPGCKQAAYRDRLSRNGPARSRSNNNAPAAP